MYRFCVKILDQSIDFERQGVREQPLRAWLAPQPAPVSVPPAPPPPPLPALLAPQAAPVRVPVPCETRPPREYAPPTHLERPAGHHTVTLLKRAGDESFGLQVGRGPTDSCVKVLTVAPRGPAARWNDNHSTDECVVVGDLLSLPGVSGLAAFTAALRERARVRLQVERSVPEPVDVASHDFPCRSRWMSPATYSPAPEVPPDSKRQMKRVVRASNEFSFVCCRCKHVTREGGQFTHGEWAVWHLEF